MSNNGNAAMNRAILAGARRGTRVTGALARLASPPLDADRGEAVSRQERLNGLLAEREDATRSSDADALAFVEHKIDKLFDDARTAARAGRETTEPEPGRGQPSGFDGGPRGRQAPPVPGVHVESAASLFHRAMLKSREERAGRDADEHTIVANI